MPWSPPTQWTGQSVPLTPAEMQKISDDLNYLHDIITGSGGGGSFINPTLTNPNLLGTTTMGNGSTDGLIQFQSLVGTKINLFSSLYGLAINANELTLFSSGSFGAAVRVSPAANAGFGDLWIKTLHLDDTAEGIINTGHGPLYLRPATAQVIIDGANANLTVGNTIVTSAGFMFSQTEVYAATGWFRNRGSGTGWMNETLGIGVYANDTNAPRFLGGPWNTEYLQSHNRHDAIARVQYTGAGVTLDATSDLWVVNSVGTVNLPDLNACYGRYFNLKNESTGLVTVNFVNGNGIWTTSLVGANTVILNPGDAMTFFAANSGQSASAPCWVVI